MSLLILAPCTHAHVYRGAHFPLFSPLEIGAGGAAFKHGSRIHTDLNHYLQYTFNSPVMSPAILLKMTMNE